MATASSFEAYTATAETFESFAQAEATPKAAAPVLVPEVGSGYREISKKRLTRTSAPATLFCGFLGVFLGVMSGVWLTMGGIHPTQLMAAQSNQPAQVTSASPAVANAVQIAQPKPEESAAVTAPNVSAPEAAASPALPQPMQTARPVAANTPVKRAVVHTTGGKKTAHIPYTPATTNEQPPAVLILAEESVPIVTKTFMEGDATVAEFDNASGRIETVEGKSFVVGRSYLSGNAVSWQDFRANVHYRCDQTGSCSLFRSGAVAPEARLTL
jgi:hypothetical protein